WPSCIRKSTLPPPAGALTFCVRARPGLDPGFILRVSAFSAGHGVDRSFLAAPNLIPPRKRGPRSKRRVRHPGPPPSRGNHGRVARETRWAWGPSLRKEKPRRHRDTEEE